MRLLTLTPDQHAYAVALVCVYTLSCAPAAALVLSRWPTPRRPRFLVVHITALAAISAAAFLTLRLPSLTQASKTAIGVSVVLGVPAGVLAGWADDEVRRRLRRLDRRERQRAATASGRRSAGDARRSPTPPAAAAPRSTGTDALWILLAVAILEEILFRGVLVDLARTLPVALAVACIAATTLLFAGSHVYQGWQEVLAKLPLGIAALAASLPLQTVVGAIVAHSIFNALAWNAARQVETHPPGHP